MIDINEILSILPHRFPFLLIDRVEELSIGESIKAYKNMVHNRPRVSLYMSMTNRMKLHIFRQTYLYISNPFLFQEV